MKRVTIAVALFLTMLFGSTAYAGGKSVNFQFDTSFVSVNWGGHFQRGKQYHRQPQRFRQHRRAAPRRIFKYGQRRHNGFAPRRNNRHFNRPMPRNNRWHQQKRRVWKR